MARDGKHANPSKEGGAWCSGIQRSDQSPRRPLFRLESSEARNVDLPYKEDFTSNSMTAFGRLQTSRFPTVSSIDRRNTVSYLFKMECAHETPTSHLLYR